MKTRGYLLTFNSILSWSSKQQNIFKEVAQQRVQIRRSFALNDI